MSDNIKAIIARMTLEEKAGVTMHGTLRGDGQLGSIGAGTAYDLDASRKAINEANVCFLMAPRHHGAMRNVAGPRVELAPTRTIFNLLGPMSNPALVKRQLVGVFDRRWMIPVATALGQLRLERALREFDGTNADRIVPHLIAARKALAKLSNPWAVEKLAELDELIATSDVISLHCPLFPETKGLMNSERIGKMKKTAFLLNTSRGPLIVEQMDATTVAPPGAKVFNDGHGYLHIELG